jgi:prepilin-type N-terminal cleavage/methylation domain-containing protein
MYSNKRGFSLLEMMLVLAVMAVVTLTGLSYLREKALNAKIDKTALQLQQWLQAGLAFYNNNGEWPKENKQLIPEPYDPQTAYLPSELKTSPWGTDYVIRREGAKPGNLFNIDLPLAASIADAKGENIGNRIAAKLPSAIWINGVLTATITPSPGPGEGGDIIFKGIYLRNLGNDGQNLYVKCIDTEHNHAFTADIPKPTCPPSNPDAPDHYVPKVFVNLQEVHFPVEAVEDDRWQGVSLRYLRAVAEDDPSDKTKWRAYLIAHGVTANPANEACRYAGTITAITACVKANYDPDEPH